MRQERFEPQVLYINTAAATAGACILCSGVESSAQAVLIWGFWQGLALVLLAAACAAFLPDGGAARGAACAALWLWLGFELAQTLWQAQSLCWQQFGSRVVIGLVPLLLWLGIKSRPEELSRAARVLWWFALCGAAVCVLGLGAQTQWQRLMAAGEWRQKLPVAPVYAEYFACRLLCPQSGRAVRRAVWQPLACFAVQAAFSLGYAMLFGGSGSYAGVELLRALSVGVFSRVDAFLLLIWVVLALYRVCFLCAAMRVVRRNVAQPRPAEGGSC